MLSINAQVEDILTNLNNPADLLFHENSMYFIDQTSVNKVDMLSSSFTVEPLFSGLTSGASLALGDGILYFADFSEGQIWKMDITNNNQIAEILVDGIQRPNMLAISDTFLYHTDSTTVGLLDEIRKIDLTDPNPQSVPFLSNLERSAIGIEIYNDELFYSETNDDNFSSIMKASLTASTPVPELLFSGINWLQGLSRCGSDIYASARDGNEILKFNPSCGSTDLQNVVSNVNNPRQTAIYGDFLYILSTTNDKIVRTPIFDQTCSIDVQEACNSYTWQDGNTYTSSTNSPTYVLPNIAGCDSIVTLDLTINNVNTNAINLTLDNVLMAEAIEADFQWLDCTNNFAPLIGETGQTFTPTSSGTYAVQITQNGCIDTSMCLDVIITSIDEMNLNSSVKIYPNPTEGEVLIEFGDLRNFEIELYSPLGELLSQNSIINRSGYTISLDNITGLYFLKLRFGEVCRVFRIIKI